MNNVDVSEIHAVFTFGLEVWRVSLSRHRILGRVADDASGDAVQSARRGTAASDVPERSLLKCSPDVADGASGEAVQSARRGTAASDVPERSLLKCSPDSASVPLIESRGDRDRSQCGQCCLCSDWKQEDCKSHSCLLRS
jgi:hypothetical protein